jgi:hypothetical protein
VHRMRVSLGAVLVVTVLVAGLAPCPPPETTSRSEAVELVPLCWCHLGEAPMTSTVAGLWLAIPSGAALLLPALPGALGEAPPGRLPDPPPDGLVPVPISV